LTPAGLEESSRAGERCESERAGERVPVPEAQRPRFPAIEMVGRCRGTDRHEIKKKDDMMWRADPRGAHGDESGIEIAGQM
jgi:hypothetical protein